MENVASTLPAKVEDELLQLAACGLTAPQIAAALELDPTAATEFVRQAGVPGSPVAVKIARGRALGVASPQVKLQEAAAAGNIDAIKALQEIQRTNRFNELINYMDDDELADQTLPH